MPRISQLPALTVPEANDEIAIVDASAATTKKITRADFLKGAALPADTVTEVSIADDAVTPRTIAQNTWQNWTPTFTSSMTISALNIQEAKYRDCGTYYEYRITSTFTLAGTATNTITISMPMNADSTAVSNSGLAGNGYVSPTATSVAGFAFLSGATQIGVRVYDSSSWTAGANRRIVIAGLIPKA